MIVSWASSSRSIIDRDLLGAVGRSRDRRELGRVTRVADGDPAEHLDALRQHVDELELLLLRACRRAGGAGRRSGPPTFQCGFL